MYQRPQAQSYSSYDAHEAYAPLPTYKGGRDKERRKGRPFWANPKFLLYAPLAIFALVLLCVMVSDRRTIARLKAENARLEASTYKKENSQKRLQDAAFEYQQGQMLAESDKMKVEAKLSDTMEKLKNLEDFFEKHQHAHKAHSEEKQLWEKEKKYLHDEIEKIRDNFRDTRKTVDMGSDGTHPAQKLLEEQAASGSKQLEGYKETGSGDVATDSGPKTKDAAEGEAANGPEKTKTGKDLTATLVKQFKHHRFSYGEGGGAAQEGPAQANSHEATTL